MLTDAELVETWNAQAAEKGHRSRRRELESRLETGHLQARRAWDEDWPDKVWDTLTGSEWRREVRTWRNSCHCELCRWERAHKRRDRRTDRYRLRLEVRQWSWRQIFQG